MKFLSICIPTYEMKGLGRTYLKQNLDMLERQSFKDFDVIISDHSEDNSIKNLCEEYKNSLDIIYVKNENDRGNSSANINNAIRKATGKLIKIIFQDDFLFSKNSLADIVENFDLEKDKWLATACEHTFDGISFFKPFYPRYHDRIHLGKNTISSPSVLTIKNDNPLLFDKKLIWSMDCDYYKRCHDAFGEPKILNSINVVNRAGSHQVSNSLVNDSIKDAEYAYLLKKYHEKNYWYLVIKRKTTTLIRHIKNLLKK